MLLRKFVVQGLKLDNTLLLMSVKPFYGSQLRRRKHEIGKGAMVGGTAVHTSPT